MKIVQVTPGLLPIPPNGWGAVEKIIWEYKLSLEKRGESVDILYLDNVKKGECDIVHVHMANLAIECYDKGIPYVFSLHDHHTVHHGKDSFRYQQNLEAIKKSVISFCHAEFLVDYFSETDKLFYLPHGVNSDFFSPDGRDKKDHRILCLANNGFGGEPHTDRKGFIPSIEAAMKLDLPITIAGPPSNRTFFEAYPEIVKYPKLSLIFDNPSEDEILELYRSHTIFINASSLEAGHPNLTILESASSGLPTISTYSGSKKIGGLIYCKRNSDDIALKIEEIISNYDHYVSETKSVKHNWDWDKICEYLISSYRMILDSKKISGSPEIKNKISSSLSQTDIAGKNNFFSKNEITDVSLTSINGLHCVLSSSTEDAFTVRFIDKDKVFYQADLKNGYWAKPSTKYYRDWKIEIVDKNGKVVLIDRFNLEGKSVLISFESSSIGDSIAWVPVIEEFRKIRKCKVYLSTFHNSLFEKKYKDINFVNPGSTVNGIYAQYCIGYWYENDSYNTEMHPSNPFMSSLQGSCSDILGIDIPEVVCDIETGDSPPSIDGKYICIAPHSTAGAKYWNNPKGWQDVIDHFNSIGYKVVYVSKESPSDPNYKNRTGELRNIIDHSGNALEFILNDIKHCKLFIGLGSGLSWAAWALKKPVVLISGFSNPEVEFSTNCRRVINTSVCHGCWSRNYFDRGDWNWCPDHKGTERQFECTKMISSDSVISAAMEICE